jgi:hypothetical protein
MKNDRPFLTVCCQCDRVKHHGRWVPMKPATMANFQHSHGLCPEHFEAAKAQLRARREKSERPALPAGATPLATALAAPPGAR